jgi:hypothetical protein
MDDVGSERLLPGEPSWPHIAEQKHCKSLSTADLVFARSIEEKENGRHKIQPPEQKIGQSEAVVKSPILLSVGFSSLLFHTLLLT